MGEKHTVDGRNRDLSSIDKSNNTAGKDSHSRTQIVVAVIGVVGVVLAALIGILPTILQATQNKSTPTVIALTNTPILPTSTASLSILLSPTPSSIQFTVRADTPWQNSGIDLQQGDHISVRYVDGYWKAAETHPEADANGYGNINDANGLVYGALLAKIGDSAPFEIGVSYSFTAAESGYLFFQINDNVLTNNSGSIIIEIVIGK